MVGAVVTCRRGQAGCERCEGCEGCEGYEGCEWCERFVKGVKCVLEGLGSVFVLWWGCRGTCEKRKR